MRINDRSTQSYKVYREHDSLVENDLKNTQQGLQVDLQNDDTGEYTVSLSGDEQGWLHWVFSTGNRRSLGAWAQAVPALLKTSDSKIYPLLDKTLTLDSNFEGKAQTSSASSDVTSARVAEETADGIPGILVQTLNHEGHQNIFFPITSDVLKCDHETALNKSTKVYAVKADGTTDPLNIGNLKQIWRVYGNQIYHLLTASFYHSSIKKGPLDFTTGINYPATVVPGTPANYAVKLAFDPVSNSWKWYAIGEAVATSIYYAKIRWNYTQYLDLSEGELLNYDPITGVFTETGTLIWIDYKFGSQVQFWTVGDDTIFTVRLLQRDVTRKASMRNLYYPTQCIQDLGKRISHLETVQKVTENRLAGNILSSDLVPNPWENPTLARAKTSLATVQHNNLILAQIPLEWDVESADNWIYTEISDFSRGQNWWFRPIEPTLDNRELKSYRCPYKKNEIYVSFYGAI